MSMVSDALRNRETRASRRRTVAGVVHSVESEGFLVRRPFTKGRRDPLAEARKRVQAQRRAEALIQTLAEPGEARQDDEIALPVVNS